MTNGTRNSNFEAKTTSNNEARRKKIKPADVRATKERVISVKPYYIIS